MPVTGTNLYSFRWFYRTRIDDNQPIQTFASSATWVTLVPQPPVLTAVAVGSQPVAAVAKSPEPKPNHVGSYYGERSPLGQWIWNGTGRTDDAWEPTLK